jgi:alcohol dehydrogenase class IV
MKSFKFKVKTHLEFGNGKIRNLGEWTKKSGYHKVGVILDKGVEKNKMIQDGIRALKDHDVEYVIFVNSAVEPDYDFLDEFKKKFIGAGFECLIGIGGGSTLDLTKGIATLVINPGPALSYRGFPELEHVPLPVIAVPTTAGTGSEVTYNAVFTNSQEKKKLGINSEYNYPVLAVIDPMILTECPISVAVSAGCDALVHSLESYVNVNHTPVSRMFSREAFKLLYNNLRKLPGGLHDVDVQSGLALGAYLAGTALMNSGAGPAGGLSYVLGGVYKVPHGFAGATFIGAVTTWNVQKGYRDYGDLYDLIEGADANQSTQEKNRLFAGCINDLLKQLGMPDVIPGYGLTSKDVDYIAGQYEMLKGVIAMNPVSFSMEDIQGIVHQALDPYVHQIVRA